MVGRAIGRIAPYRRTLGTRNPHAHWCYGGDCARLHRQAGQGANWQYLVLPLHHGAIAPRVRGLCGVGCWMDWRGTTGLGDECKWLKTTCPNPTVPQRPWLTYRGYPTGDGSCLPVVMGQHGPMVPNGDGCCVKGRWGCKALAGPRCDRIQRMLMVPKCGGPVPERVVRTKGRGYHGRLG
jgi:hypothetical protein